MPANRLVSVKTPQTIAEPVVKPTSTPTMIIVPVYASGGPLSGWKLQFTLRWDATMKPMPAETEHDSVPTWTRRGCASATAAAASIAMPATDDKKDLGDTFLPQLTTISRLLTHPETERN